VSTGLPATVTIQDGSLQLQDGHQGEALCQMEPVAVPALRSALQSSNNRVREEAAVVLKKIDSEAHPHLG
jgi:hypothetical protein